MKYHLLGKLHVAHEDGQAHPALRRQVQVLLATLLSQANRVVSGGQLIDQLWNGNPPRSATAALHVYVSQLRKHLTVEGDSPLRTVSPGYQLVVRPGELDLDVFRDHTRRGREQLDKGRLDEAGRHFERALDLWRGTALAGLSDNAAINAYTSWLDELHVECAEMFVECQFARGRAAETIPLLRDLMRQHPLHETCYRQLMRALHRTNRRAEALETFQLAKRALSVELGVEPCRASQTLYHRILRDDPPLATASPARV